MKFLTLQVPDSDYEFYKELMNKLGIKATDDNGMNFLRVYSDDEPEYTMDDIKEPNPLYKKKKKDE